MWYPLEEQKNRSKNIGMSVAAGILFLYVLCAPIFQLPLAWIYRKHAHYAPAVYTAVHLFYTPINFLEEHIPGYNEFLHRQSQILGLRE